MLPSPDQDNSHELMVVNNDLTKKIESVVENVQSSTLSLNRDIDAVVAEADLWHGIKERSQMLFDEDTQKQIDEAEAENKEALNKIKSATFADTEGASGIHVAIEVATDEIVKGKVVGQFFQNDDDVPTNLLFPAVALTVWSTKKDLPVSTPYGDLPHTHAHDIGERLFLFTNTFYLNQSGQGFKHEDVMAISTSEESLPEVLEKEDVDPTQVVGKPLIMSEDDSRFVPISREDYKMISSHIDKIAEGTYKQIR